MGQAALGEGPPLDAATRNGGPALEASLFHPTYLARVLANAATGRFPQGWRSKRVGPTLHHFDFKDDAVDVDTVESAA